MRQLLLAERARGSSHSQIQKQIYERLISLSRVELGELQ